MTKLPILILPFGLMACGGTSNSDFPVKLEPDLTAMIADGELSVAVDGTTVVVPLAEDDEIPAGFVGGRSSGDIYNMAARFESDTATATIATQIADEDFVIATSFERLAVVETPLTGTATAEGTVVSAFTPVLDEDDLEPALLLPSQINETIVLNIDFDDQLIDGQITTDVAFLQIPGFGELPFSFDDDINTIDLLETSIQSDGEFDGVARLANNPDAEDGTYSGLIAGEGGDTVVGAFALPGRTGVFQATTE